MSAVVTALLALLLAGCAVSAPERAQLRREAREDRRIEREERMAEEQERMAASMAGLRQMAQAREAMAPPVAAPNPETERRLWGLETAGRELKAGLDKLLAVVAEQQEQLRGLRELLWRLAPPSP